MVRVNLWGADIFASCQAVIRAAAKGAAAGQARAPVPSQYRQVLRNTCNPVTAPTRARFESEKEGMLAGPRPRFPESPRTFGQP